MMAFSHLSWGRKCCLTLLIGLLCEGSSENSGSTLKVQSQAGLPDTSRSIQRIMEARDAVGGQDAVLHLQDWSKKIAHDNGEAVPGDTAGRAAMTGAAFEDRDSPTGVQTSVLQQSLNEPPGPSDDRDRGESSSHDEPELVAATGPGGGWKVEDDPKAKDGKGAEYVWVPKEETMPENPEEEASPDAAGDTIDPRFGRWEWSQDQYGGGKRYEWVPTHKDGSTKHGHWSWVVAGDSWSGGKYPSFVRPLREAPGWPLGHLERKWNDEKGTSSIEFEPISPTNGMEPPWAGVPSWAQEMKLPKMEKKHELLRKERLKHDREEQEWQESDAEMHHPLPYWEPAWTPPAQAPPSMSNWHHPSQYSSAPPVGFGHDGGYNHQQNQQSGYNHQQNQQSGYNHQQHQQSGYAHQQSQQQSPYEPQVPDVQPNQHTMPHPTHTIINNVPDVHIAPHHGQDKELREDHDLSWKGTAGYATGNVGYYSSQKVGTWEQGQQTGEGHAIAAHHQNQEMPSQMHPQQGNEHNSYAMQYNSPYGH